jgi:hypothetical protein
MLNHSHKFSFLQLVRTEILCIVLTHQVSALKNIYELTTASPAKETIPFQLAVEPSGPGFY